MGFSASSERILLVLDLDETLVHSSEKPLANLKADERILGYHVHKRPGLDQFLSLTSQHFELAVWSAGGGDYVHATTKALMEPLSIKPLFVWTSSYCTRRFDPETQEHYHIKDFNKLRRRGIDLARALIVENTPANCQRNYGNAVYIKSFEGDVQDSELPHLADYLLTLTGHEDLRKIEKRDWQSARL